MTYSYTNTQYRSMNYLSMCSHNPAYRSIFRHMHFLNAPMCAESVYRMLGETPQLILVQQVSLFPLLNNAGRNNNNLFRL